MLSSLHRLQQPHQGGMVGPLPTPTFGPLFGGRLFTCFPRIKSSWGPPGPAGPGSAWPRRAGGRPGRPVPHPYQGRTARQAPPRPFSPHPTPGTPARSRPAPCSSWRPRRGRTVGRARPQQSSGPEGVRGAVARRRPGAPRGPPPPGGQLLRTPTGPEPKVGIMTMPAEADREYRRKRIPQRLGLATRPLGASTPWGLRFQQVLTNPGRSEATPQKRPGG
jgi:hypothetical protein